MSIITYDYYKWLAVMMSSFSMEKYPLVFVVTVFLFVGRGFAETEGSNISSACFGAECNNKENVARRIRVQYADPYPNYQGRKYLNALKQLTDNKLLPYPSWKYENGVGWQRATPILLDVDVDLDNVGTSGVFKFFTEKRVRSGVFIPQRIDIYMKNDHGYRHVGGSSFDNDEYSDNSKHELDVHVGELSHHMRMVIHSYKEYVMLDEISIYIDIPRNQKSLSFGSVNDPKTDSIKRLKEHFISKIHNDNKIGSKLCGFWIDDPFAENIMQQRKSCFNNLDSVFSGYLGEFSEKILVIDNMTPKPKTILLEAENDSVNMFEVVRTLSADGKVIYDPLVPINDKITIKPGETVYIWIARKLVGNCRDAINIRINMEIWKRMTISCRVDETVNLDNLPNPNVFVWAYTYDKPIWKNPETSVDDLVDHGVNVFVVHPKSIPALGEDNKFKTPYASKMTQTLNLYKNKGKVLLFLEWNKNRFLKRREYRKHHEKIKQYVKSLTSYMRSVGYEYKEWAMYPEDEPNGEDLEDLIGLFKLIKSIDPEIQLYTNPAITSGSIPDVSTIYKIGALVEFIQPSAQLVKVIGSDVFKRLKADYWMYKNPKSPAKSTSPSIYQSMGIKAYRLGANGFGFWSYSDTRGSSAWDDFDGSRPDWAVVYEGKDGKIISSRRWEAFRDGVEKYKIMKAGVN